MESEDQKSKFPELSIAENKIDEKDSKKHTEEFMTENKISAEQHPPPIQDNDAK